MKRAWCLAASSTEASAKQQTVATRQLRAVLRQPFRTNRPLTCLSPGCPRFRWCQQSSDISVNNLGQRLRRGEGDILLPRFDERDVLLEQACRFRELRLRQAHFQPSRFQVGAENGDDVVLIGLVRAGPTGNGSGHRSGSVSRLTSGGCPPRMVGGRDRIVTLAWPDATCSEAARKGQKPRPSAL
jgi:hypothetical protein